MSALSYVIDVVRSKQSKGILSEEIFFRGQREKHTLVPCLLRPHMKYKKSISTTENNFYCDALVMAAADISRVNSSWQALALFQHYEIPTRLLDWTSSLTSALFFALLPCLKCPLGGNCKKLKKSCDGAPVIWVIDPHKMHKSLYPGEPIKDNLTITVGIDPLPDYRDEFVLKEATANDWPYKNGPVFLEIPWTDSRIRNQKGFFTFHIDGTPLETQLDESKGLVSIPITKKYRRDIMQEFDALGITEYDIFTDLVSLANYFKRRYTTIPNKGVP